MSCSRVIDRLTLCRNHNGPSDKLARYRWSPFSAHVAHRACRIANGLNPKPKTSMAAASRQPLPYNNLSDPEVLLHQTTLDIRITISQQPSHAFSMIHQRFSVHASPSCQRPSAKEADAMA